MTSTILADAAGRTRRRAAPWDLVIVGGGISGAATLWHATTAGMRALLVERHHIAAGPTGSSTANLRRHYSSPALAYVAAESFRVYGDFATLIGLDVALVRTGVLLAVAPDEVEAFEASVARLRAGGARIELLGRSEISELVPEARIDDLGAAVYEPEGGYADAAAAANGFVGGAVRAGAQAWLNTRVSAIVVERGRVRGVELDDGRRVAAARVLIAAGPWTNELLNPIGQSLPTFAERNAISVLHVPDGARQVVPCVFSDRPRRYYLRPEGESTVLVGGRTNGTSVVARPDALERSVPLAESAEIVGRVSERLPRLSTAGIRPGYADLYDVSPDGFPIVGAIPATKGLFVWAGTSGHGFRLAPGIAGLLVKRIRGRRARLLDSFRVDRDYTPTGELTPR